MGTHPIFESDFDCLTGRQQRKPTNWPFSHFSNRSFAPQKPATTVPSGHSKIAPFVLYFHWQSSLTQPSDKQLEHGIDIRINSLLKDNECPIHSTWWEVPEHA